MKTAGIVLAGGASSRMGQDKALLRWQGRTMLERQLLLLGALKLDETFIAGSRPGYPHVPDATAHAGPLAALAGLLGRFEEDTRLLVIPIDMPLLTLGHLRPLLEDSAPLTAYRDHPLPLALTVRPELRHLILTRLNQGRASLKGLWETLPGARWQEAPDAVLANANTPAEWQALLHYQKDPA